jgi:hypothetical protein
MMLPKRPTTTTSKPLESSHDLVNVLPFNILQPRSHNPSHTNTQPDTRSARCLYPDRIVKMQDSADTEQANAQPPAKDGEHTLHGWLTLAGSFLVYFVSFGYINSFGFFQEHYARHELSDYPLSLIALIGSLQLGLMYLVGPVAGALSDAYGPTRLYAIAAVGTVAASVGVSFAQPGQIWQFFLSQVGWTKQSPYDHESLTGNRAFSSALPWPLAHMSPCLLSASTSNAAEAWPSAFSPVGAVPVVCACPSCSPS